jgi:hypothetical protein
VHTFAEFWPYYVREHSHRGNRLLHAFGTLTAIGLLIVMLVMGWWWVALALPLVGYGFAWLGHLVLQKNRPATFRHPFWSLAADFRMVGLTVLGRMNAEVARALSLGPNSHVGSN